MSEKSEFGLDDSIRVAVNERFICEIPRSSVGEKWVEVTLSVRLCEPLSRPEAVLVSGIMATVTEAAVPMRLPIELDPLRAWWRRLLRIA